MFRREVEIAVELVGKLRDPIDRLRLLDKGLAEFLRRASCKLAVTVDELRWHDEREQAELVTRAQEYVSELYAGLQLAESWGHIDAPTVAQTRLLLDAEMQLLERGTARLAVM
jgi:hypothetical protein